MAVLTRLTEYIGQLEGEVAAKAQEANDLRVQNQQLREENTRLTDLTRMLLSSQAFSGFLQELSQSGLPPPNVQKALQQQKALQNQAQPQPQPQPTKKDVNSNVATQQMPGQQPQIGMALIPEIPVDFSALQPANGWMNALPTNDFQVYAVAELPTPPALDLEILSGKPSHQKGTSKACTEVPQLPELPSEVISSSTVEAEAQIDDSVHLDQDAFALYFDHSASNLQQPSEEIEIAETESSSELSNEEKLIVLRKMCFDLDESCDKLSAYTSHME